jgi:hypothetical protein
MDAAVGAAPDVAGRAACVVDGTTVGMWFSVVQEGELSIDPATGRFVFTPTGPPEIGTEIEGMDDPYCAAILGNYIRQTIASAWPTVIAKVIESFPTPRFELPGIGTWTMKNFQIDRIDRYHNFRGTLGAGGDQ